MIETSVGRIIFNSSFPNDYPYINRLIDNKALKGIVREVIEKYSNEDAVVIIDKVKTLGFEYCTLSGVSWGMDDLIVPKEKKGLIDTAEEEVRKIDSHFEKGLLSAGRKNFSENFNLADSQNKIGSFIKNNFATRWTSYEYYFSRCQSHLGSARSDGGNERFGEQSFRRYY